MPYRESPTSIDNSNCDFYPSWRQRYFGFKTDTYILHCESHKNIYKIPYIKKWKVRYYNSGFSDLYAFLYFSTKRQYVLVIQNTFNKNKSLFIESDKNFKSLISKTRKELTKNSERCSGYYSYYTGAFHLLEELELLLAEKICTIIHL